MAKQREEYDSMMKRMGGGITTGNPMQIFDTTKPLVETQPQPAVDPAVQQEMARRQYLQARGLAAGKAYEEKQAAQLEKSRQFLEAKRRIQGMSLESGRRIIAQDKAAEAKKERERQNKAERDEARKMEMDKITLPLKARAEQARLDRENKIAIKNIDKEIEQLRGSNKIAAIQKTAELELQKAQKKGELIFSPEWIEVKRKDNEKIVNELIQKGKNQQAEIEAKRQAELEKMIIQLKASAAQESPSDESDVANSAMRAEGLNMLAEDVQKQMAVPMSTPQAQATTEPQAVAEPAPQEVAPVETPYDRGGGIRSGTELPENIAGAATKNVAISADDEKAWDHYNKPERKDTIEGKRAIKVLRERYGI